MTAAIVGDIEKIFSMLYRSPLDLLLSFILFTFIYFFHWLFRDLKVEHLFRYTLNNRIKRLEIDITGGIVDKEQKKSLKKRYSTLLNQRDYGVKNRLIQQQVIGIINCSSEITNLKYFAVHQYVLSIDNDGKLYFNKSKIKSRIFTALMLLVTGLAALALGIFITSAGSFFGLVISLLGLLLYFAGLVHFPTNPGMRKRAEKEIAYYYQLREAR